MLGAVIPLKDEGGETSTAIDGSEGGACRLTWTDCQDRGQTWTEPGLLVATGCLLIDIEALGVDTWSTVSEGLFFSMHDAVVWTGLAWEARVEPEDWQFCRLLQAADIAVWATTAVPMGHVDGTRVWARPEVV